MFEGAGAVFAVTCGGSIGCAVGGADGGGGGGCDAGGGAGGCTSSGGGGGGSVCANAGAASTNEKRRTNVFIMADRSFRRSGSAASAAAQCDARPRNKPAKLPPLFARRGVRASGPRGSGRDSRSSSREPARPVPA